MDIKYVEVPIRVKPHHDYLDMKGVEELWIKIKEYVAEHGGEGATGGSVNEEEVNAIIAAYYASHKDELKGEPFTYADFTAAQLEALRGPRGADGVDGRDGIDGTITFEELTDEQKETLRGPAGPKGDAFTYADFTEEQLEALRGPKGADGTMTFTDLTDEQRESLRGPEGPQGAQGVAFTYSDFTEEQLEALRGPQGLQGETGPQGERGQQGIQGERGVQGVPGIQGPAGEVDYSLVYTKAQVDDLLRNVDLNPEDIDLSDYYNKDELYNKGQIDALIASLVIEGAAGVHVGPDEPTVAGVSVWVDTDGVAYEGEIADLTDTFYTKSQIDYALENHGHRLSEMQNDVGFITSIDNMPTKTSDLVNDSGFIVEGDVYRKSETYDKIEVDTALTNFWRKDDELPEGHMHMNKSILDSLSEANGKLLYNGEQIATGDEIDLSDYAKQSIVNAQIEQAISTKANSSHTHSEYEINGREEITGYEIYQGNPNNPTKSLTSIFNGWATDKGFLKPSSLDGYLRYQVVTEAPAVQQNGVLYIVTE